MYNLIRTNDANKLVVENGIAQGTFSLQNVNRRFFYLCLLLTIFLFASTKVNSQSTSKFNDGYITVLKVSNSTALASSGTQITAEEFVPTTASQTSANYSVALPITGSNKVVVAGTSTASGLATLSENGRYFLIPGYNATVGDANSTFTTNGAIRTVNGTGTVGAGIAASATQWLSGSNGVRSATTDDGTNYWISGATIGIQYINSTTSVTTVSTSNTNTRGLYIYNGQLYYAAGAGLQGISSVGTGKPTTAGTSTATRLFTPTNTDASGFSISPDGLTIYYVAGTSGGVYRSINTSGTWSAGTLITTGFTGGTGIAVDWRNYTFNSSAANGAKIFACNPTTVVAGNDNGTSAMTLTTLRTAAANSAFRGLSFSPIKQTVSRGASSPATGSILLGGANTALFQFNLSADEGNSTITKVIVNNSGTATLGSGNDISNIRLVDDANGNGVFDAGETVLSTGSVSGSNITFSSITLSSYINEGTSKNFLVIGDVSATATTSRTFVPGIVSNKSLNTVNYTTNLVNAGSSFVFIGSTAPNGNTLTITSPVSAPISGGNKLACFGATIPDLTASVNTGETVDWYAAASGGSALASGSNSFATLQTAVGTYTYYAEARNTTNGLTSPTRTAVTLTINAIVTPTVEIDASDLAPIPGDFVDFYVIDETNQGSSPSYQWYKNGALISGANSATYTTNVLADGDQLYLKMTSNAACPSDTTVQSNTLTVTIVTNACTGVPATTATTTAANVCSGGSSNLALTGLGGNTGYTFQWQKATTSGGSYTDISGETNATYAATNLTGTFWYRCNITCASASVTVASSPVQINVTANLTPSVSIVSSKTPSCSGSSVTYTATPTNGGSSPSYAWYLNGNPVGGVTGATYSSSAFADGDLIYAVLTSNYTCLTTPTATSTTALQNVTPNVAASVSIASSANPACAGANVTFTATPTNGGTPAYQWYSGATPISGANSSTYSSSSLTNNTSISVVMTSSVTCVTGSPATSNTVVQLITANVTPTLTIASNNNPVCISGNATFNINPVNGGASPGYAWYLNGNLVSGQNGSTYTLSPVTDQDSVYATMVSSATCVTTPNATSNVIHESVVSQSTPSVTITASPSTSINEGTNITFTASPTFGGATPSYQWKVNGSNVGTNSATYSSTTLLHGDVVTCVITSNYTCLTTSTATSNSLTITILGNAPFTPGNLIVYRAGDSVNTLVTNAMPIFLAEYTTSGNFVQAKRISKNSTGVNSIYCSGSSTSEGMLTLNTNGTNLVVPGYYTALNTASITTSASATINRVVALIDVNQNVDTTTRLSDWSTGGSPRGAAASGNSIYVTGSVGGTRYAAKGATTSTQLSTSVTNMRNVNIFNGQLYASDNSGTTFKLSSIGTGLPTTSGQTMVNLPGFPTASTSQPYGFFFADLSSSVAGLDVVYVADDVANTITKYSLVSGTWTSNGTITATTVKGLTASVSGTTVSLYATATTSSPASTYIYSYTDNSGYNGSVSGTATKLVDRTNVSLMAFRGIAFAPTSFTTQPSSTTVCSDATTTLAVAMTAGTSASIYAYQWQASVDGTNWSNISNGSVYSNVTTASLSVNNPAGLNGMKYRCIVTYMGATTMISNTATLTVITTVTPSVSINTASTTVCSGNSTTFTATASNGGSLPLYQWKKNGTNLGTITTNNTYTFAANSLATNDVVSCELTANNVCQTTPSATSNNVVLTVNASPSLATITSAASSNTTALTMCKSGSVISLYPNPTVGVWASSDPSIVSVVNNTGTSSTSITAAANGTAVVTFTRTTPNTTCTAVSSIVVTVQEQATPNPISGLSSLCVGSSTTYTTTSTGGVWSTTGRLDINSSGIATGTSAGTTSVRYTTTNANGCSASSVLNVTVNALPAIPSIAFAPGTSGVSGTGGYCRNKTFTLVGSPNGGVWSKTGVITISPLGVVNTGSLTGAASVTYSYTNSNGCTSSRSIATNIVNCGSKGTISNSEIANQQFVIYPNPAHQMINLQVTKLVGVGQIVVTDLYGKQVAAQALSLGNNSINVSKFAKGLYLVSITTSEGRSTQKIIVE